MLKECFDNLVRNLEEVVREFYGEKLVSLAIYGSVASEVMRPDSDLDIFICAENLPRGRHTRIKEFQTIEKSLEPVLKEMRDKGLYPSLSPVIKTPEETKAGSLIFIDMTENVKILFDRNDFFQNHLNELKTKLKNLGSRKIQVGNAWFWDLVPNFKLIKEVSL